MKAKERHQLKRNEFARTTVRVLEALKTNRERAVVLGLAAVVLLAAVGGYAAWRRSQSEKAGALLGVARAAAQARISPPSSLPGAVQAPGTYPTEQARNEAALEAYQAVIEAYPSSSAALTATYEQGAAFVALGRSQEAQAAYEKVAAAGSPLYSPMARLGLVQVKLAAGDHAAAAELLTELSGDRDSSVPVDGVLMELAQTYAKAGRPEEARAAYKRIVDEFADSVYVADARQRLAQLN
jgi:tetratricopeptide (TPR) repeat protein